MNAIRKRLIELISDIPENELGEVFDFIEFLKMKKQKNDFKDLLVASESSLDFWDNEIDDQVWNES
jgi:hypothetical protein